MCLPARAIGLQAGRGHGHGHRVTRRGRVYAPNGITHRTMGKPITDAIDNLEASIDEGGNWKTFERALELVCSQRVQNVWKAETSKHSATKRKPTCSLSLCLPDSGPLQNQTTGTRQSARLLSLVFQPSGHSVKGRSIRQEQVNFLLQLLT